VGSKPQTAFTVDQYVRLTALLDQVSGGSSRLMPE